MTPTEKRVLAAARRWYACDVLGKQTRAQWYSSEAGPLAVACAADAKARKARKK